MHSTSPHYRQLQPEDQITMVSLQQQKYSVRAMARVLHRSPGTISRELIRNADVSGYASFQAQKFCQHRRQSARPQPRLHAEASLFGVVHHFLLAHWSPAQIALTQACMYPKGHKSQVARGITMDARRYVGPCHIKQLFAVAGIFGGPCEVTQMTADTMGFVPQVRGGALSMSKHAGSMALNIQRGAPKEIEKPTVFIVHEDQTRGRAQALLYQL